MVPRMCIEMIKGSHDQFKMHCNEAFILLKPVCDQVVRKASKENLYDLEKVMTAIPPETLHQLQDYILYPLELNLKRPDIKTENKRHILDTVKHLILHSKVASLGKFIHLYSLIFFQIFDQGATNMVADVSEELKLSVVQCANQLIWNSGKQVFCDLYKKKYTPRLSQGVFMCMQLMQNEKLRSLRIAAIEFTMAITQTDDKTTVFEDTWRPNVADTLMFLVPGMLTGLHKVAVGDEIQGHLVTLMAVRAWSCLLALVLEDVEPERLSLLGSASKPTPSPAAAEARPDAGSDPSAALDELQEQQRTAAWAQGVSEHVPAMAERLRGLQTHSHWQVRLELAEACRRLIASCHRHLDKSLIVFVEVLLKLSDDESSPVAQRSHQALEQVQGTLEGADGVGLLELLEENLYSLVGRIPRIFNVEGDEQKLAELSLLKQHLHLLGPERLPQLLRSAPHLERAMLALLQAAELDTATVTLLEEPALRELEPSQQPSLQRPWRQFRHFLDPAIALKLQEVCRLLGSSGDLDVVCDHLLQLIASGCEHQNESILLLGEVLVGGAGRDLDHLVRAVLDTYLQPDMWQSAVGAGLQPSAARTAVLRACLLVEGIGKAACALGSGFRFHLYRALYPVAERAGSAHPLLAASGLCAATDIARAVEQGESMGSLLAANMDYFLVRVTLRLRSLHRDASVLGVLCVAVRHSTAEALPHLQALVSDVLLDSCDTHQMRHASSFLQVFHTFFLRLRDCYGQEQPSEKPSTLQLRQPPCSAAAVVSQLLEYHQNKQLSSWDATAGDVCCEPEGETAEGDGDSEGEGEGEGPPPLPPHLQAAELALGRCLRLLPTRDQPSRLLALAALRDGLPLLAARETQLLPLVHQTWAPLTGLLKAERDPLTLRRAFQLLRTLACLARDFLRARTLKLVLPALTGFLTSAAEQSRCKDTGSAFRFTQVFQLQMELLQGLGPLATDLQLQLRDLHQLMAAGRPYLGCLQPRPLQESGVQLFRTLAAYNADAVWLEVMQLQKGPNNGEYEKNIQLVLLSVN